MAKKFSNSDNHSPDNTYLKTHFNFYSFTGFIITRKEVYLIKYCKFKRLEYQ